MDSQVAERREPPGRVREKMRGRRTARAVPLQNWGKWAYACVSHGPLILHLSEIGGTQNAKLFVEVPDVDAVYEEFTKNGLKTDAPQSVPAIHLRRFDFEDSDGHSITFASALPDQPKES